MHLSTKEKKKKRENDFHSTPFVKNTLTSNRSTLGPTTLHRNDCSELVLCTNAFRSDADERNFLDDDRSNGHALKFPTLNLKTERILCNKLNILILSELCYRLCSKRPCERTKADENEACRVNESE